MSDGASVREVEFQRVTTSVSVDRGAARGQFSDLRSRAYRSAAASRVLPRSDVDAGVLCATSRRTELFLRLLDIAGSLGILLLTLPVIVVVSLLVRITAGGPVLFRQERVGLGGRVFTLYKFRTMVNDAEKARRPDLGSPATTIA